MDECPIDETFNSIREVTASFPGVRKVFDRIRVASLEFNPRYSLTFPDLPLPVQFKVYELREFFVDSSQEKTCYRFVEVELKQRG